MPRRTSFMPAIIWVRGSAILSSCRRRMSAIRSSSKLDAKYRRTRTTTAVTRLIIKLFLDCRRFTSFGRSNCRWSLNLDERSTLLSLINLLGERQDDVHNFRAFGNSVVNKYRIERAVTMIAVSQAATL